MHITAVECGGNAQLEHVAVVGLKLRSSGVTELHLGTRFDVVLSAHVPFQ